MTMLKVFLKLLLKPLQCLLLLAVVALTASAVQAQDSQEPAPALQNEVQADSQGSAQETDSELELETDESTEESGGRFIPSEEISQDFGVSFPVDI
jgi:hypothetical protein